MPWPRIHLPVQSPDVVEGKVPYWAQLMALSLVLLMVFEKARRRTDGMVFDWVCLKDFEKGRRRDQGMVSDSASRKDPPMAPLRAVLMVPAMESD